MVIQAAAIGLILLASAQGAATEGSTRGELLGVSGSGAGIVNRSTSARDRRRERDVDRIYRRFLRGRLSAALAARQILDRSQLEATDRGITGVMFPKAGPHSTPEQEEKTAELMLEMTRLIRLRGELDRHLDQ